MTTRFTAGGLPATGLWRRGAAFEFRTIGETPDADPIGMTPLDGHPAVVPATRP